MMVSGLFYVEVEQAAELIRSGWLTDEVSKEWATREGSDPI